MITTESYFCLKVINFETNIPRVVTEHISIKDLNIMLLLKYANSITKLNIVSCEKSLNVLRFTGPIKIIKATVVVKRHMSRHYSITCDL